MGRGKIPLSVLPCLPNSSCSQLSLLWKAGDSTAVQLCQCRGIRRLLHKRDHHRGKSSCAERLTDPLSLILLLAGSSKVLHELTWKQVDTEETEVRRFTAWNAHWRESRTVGFSRISLSSRLWTDQAGNGLPPR